jgi:para-aminobenzoate synthetase component 1
LNKSALTNCKFPHTDQKKTKNKVLSWIKQFDTFCFLDNNGYPQGFEHCIAAASPRAELDFRAGAALEKLDGFVRSHAGSWMFGHLGYDLKNEIEPLDSRHTDRIGFPDLYFFEAGIVIQITPGELIIEAEDPQQVFEQVEASSEGDIHTDAAFSANVKQVINREEYLDIIRRLKAHIHRGDSYEINFCQEFFAENVEVSAVQLYRKLTEVSASPFSALYRLKDKWLICASPERFLQKQGDRIISQPMKGTVSRDFNNAVKDGELRNQLFHSPKERSENVMVVDLVRNDLSKICKEGSVKVDELFGIYPFPQVYQMVSTVSGKLHEGTGLAEIIAACFPMGSMTGAPKRRVMELIEQYEKTKRGLFSGSLGYIDPRGDFDLNVVIRSLFYNSATKDLSFQAGSGITFYSDPENEWEECMLKAGAIRSLLGS